jgi:uncharacterized membrane protein
MKKIVVIGLVALALIVGFVFLQNAGARGAMMGRGSWWQPSSWNWGAYCPWNNWGYRSSDYRNYRNGYGWGGCRMMNQGWGAGYQGYPYPFENPQAPQQSPQGR